MFHSCVPWTSLTNALVQLQLEREINNFLDTATIINPEHIIKKPKFHILQHIIKNICQFRPSILFSTEIFECYNAIFCACSIFSNHHSPSCNISVKFCNMYHFKHIVSGGWWIDLISKQWICAGQDVHQFFLKHGQMQEYLG